jgi:hypothetical protein
MAGRDISKPSLADCEDADVEEMSFASRSSTGHLVEGQGQESKWGIQTFSSEQTQDEEDLTAMGDAENKAAIYTQLRQMTNLKINNTE